MRRPVALVVFTTLSSCLAAGAPPRTGEAGPRGIVSPAEAKRFIAAQPRTRGHVLRLIGPPARESWETDPRELAKQGNLPWLTRWDYYTADGWIRVILNGDSVVRFGYGGSQ